MKNRTFLLIIAVAIVLDITAAFVKYYGEIIRQYSVFPLFWSFAIPINIVLLILVPIWFVISQYQKEKKGET
jgi:hypothetical protein